MFTWCLRSLRPPGDTGSYKIGSSVTLAASRTCRILSRKAFQAPVMILVMMIMMFLTRMMLSIRIMFFMSMMALIMMVMMVMTTVFEDYDADNKDGS